MGEFKDSLTPDEGASASTAALTILSAADGKISAKRFTPNGVQSYGKGYWYHWRAVNVPDFETLAQVLHDLESRSFDSIILGQVSDDYQNSPKIRRVKKDKPDYRASLVDCGSRVVHFDMDDLELPPETSWQNPAEIAAFCWAKICARLPAFKGVSYYWQASASAGTAGKEHLAKFHIWALLDAPITEDRRKALLEMAGADTSVATISQLNYTAAPLFEGVADPLAGLARSGAVIGPKDSACLSDIPFPGKAPAARGPRKAPQAAPKTPAYYSDVTSDWGAQLLSHACDAIASLSPGGRNGAINRKAYTIGGHVGAGDISYQDALSRLMEAGARSGHARYAEAIENGLRDGIRTPFKRAQDGRFTGEGLRNFAGTTPQAGAPLSLNEARMKTAGDIQAALDGAAAWDGEGDAPAFVIASDPGFGKSTLMRALLARPENLARIKGDVQFYSPTLALSDAGADHATELGIVNAVTRGRLATNPATGTPMCDRAPEVARIGKLGLPIKATMCQAKDEFGKERNCPFFTTCAYFKQFVTLPDVQTVRFGALNYLTLPDPAKGRPTGLRVIDETSWRAMGRDAALTIDSLSSRRSIGKVKSGPEKDARTAVINDLLHCVNLMMAALRRGTLIMQAIADYTAQELLEFAKAERWSDHDLPIFPDASQDAFERALKGGEALILDAGAKAQFWINLAKAKAEGIEDLQNVVFVAGYKPRKKSEPRDVIRVFWHISPPLDVPTIILDADADSILTEPFYPKYSIATTKVLPNADITYITDRTFSKRRLLTKSARDEWRGAIAVERMNDAGGGVLVIATRAVVKAFFRDAGYDFSKMDNAQASAFMIETPLHGVQWAWFGSATLGSNRWRDCTTCLVIGREEWPPQALEDEARKIWGHGIALLKPDAKGNHIMPEVETPFPMADGSVKSVMVRAHPDPRVRAIQMQARERATRQSVERLRLASARLRKRVVIGSKVPIPGLPATHALTWAQYMPAREEIAFAEAGGALRLSPKGLAEDAPQTFRTAKAAAGYSERNDLVKSLFDPHTSNRGTISGVGVKNRILVSFRIKGSRGSAKTRAILQCAPEDAARLAYEKWGPLVAFEIEQTSEPKSADSKDALDDCKERAARLPCCGGFARQDAERTASG